MAYHNRGQAFLESGEYDRAVADFTAALRLAPKFTKVYLAAIADCTEVIRLAPRDPLAYKHRAAFHRALGQADQAAKDEQLAKELSQ
jgi:tetratricopeptide (TPR) repeat protein